MSALNEQIISVRKYLENKLNTYSEIKLGPREAALVINVIRNIENMAEQLENCIVPDHQKVSDATEGEKVIRIDLYKARKEAGKCSA